MSFVPLPFPPGTPPYLKQFEEGDDEREKEDLNEKQWTPLFQHCCTFPPEIFAKVMRNLIQNPNINSTHLFRADIKTEVVISSSLDRDLIFTSLSEAPVRIVKFQNFDLTRVVVRTLIPRNVNLDNPLDESCLFYENQRQDVQEKVLSLVVYLPHIDAACESPFYHPAVYGISFLHEFSPKTRSGNISIHYSFFMSNSRSEKLDRTAHHLLGTLYKHGQGTAAGYVKRVFHDVILPQALFQNTYTRLKAKYSRALIDGWVESTDPVKHVFEDLSIAAFLIELWNEMYQEEKFPGFVDIGCGNGLLVHILRAEGYAGWGFDARYRKSWLTYTKSDQENLKELILMPSMILSKANSTLRCTGISKVPSCTDSNTEKNFESREKVKLQDTKASSQKLTDKEVNVITHDEIFPSSPFIISNHADELTPWTPFIATASKSPFIMIPCCSYDLSGARFRASPTKDFQKNKKNSPQSPPRSKYALLVDWVSQIAQDCGWQVEREMLRIPSTRNTALIGRTRSLPYENIDLSSILEKYGGAADWEKNALLLWSKACKGSNRGH